MMFLAYETKFTVGKSIVMVFTWSIVRGELDHFGGRVPQPMSM